jgi:hypothetical protein
MDISFAGHPFIIYQERAARRKKIMNFRTRLPRKKVGESTILSTILQCNASVKQHRFVEGFRWRRRYVQTHPGIEPENGYNIACTPSEEGI